MSYRAAALVVAVALTACRDSTGPGFTGEFSGNVTGGHTQSLKGDAFFGLGNVVEGSASGFSIVLLEGSALGQNDDLIMISRAQGDRPAVGTYPIVSGEADPPASSEFVAVWFPATGEEINGTFTGTGGSLTITSSASARLRGTFEFNATGGFDADPETILQVTVTGTFDAVHIDGSSNLSARVSNVRVQPADDR